MKYIECTNGDPIPALGLGTWKSKPGEVGGAVRTAIRLGYRHIDCAAIYGNQAEIGEALAGAMRDGEVKREELWITSKLWNNRHLAADVEPALDETLRELQLDSLDLYLIHWPVALRPEVSFPQSGDDFLTLEQVPLAETWAALESCHRKGKVRHLGFSNFSAKKVQEVVASAHIRPTMNQVELHPYLQQSALLDSCARERILVTAYSPLGSRDRDPRMKAKDEPDLLANATIAAIAESKRITPAQVLLAWALTRGTLVIPKSVTPAHLESNLAAADIELTSDEMEQIAALDRHYRYVNGIFWVRGESPYTLESLWDEPASPRR